MFDTLNERVSHVERTSLCLRAHAFHTRSKRVYGFVCTCFTQGENAFTSSRPRARTHFSRRRVHVRGEYVIAILLIVRLKVATRVLNVQGQEVYQRTARMSLRKQSASWTGKLVCNGYSSLRVKVV